jgi:Tfp pilus assembly protein PilW
MRRSGIPSKAAGGFTLVETMVSLTVSAFILLAVVLATVGFQKVFVATDEYYKATSDQTRVLDYLAMDMREAASGSVSNSGQTVTLILPDYLDTGQDPPVPRTPTISAGGDVIYGVAGTAPTAAYTITGNPPRQVIQRTYTPSSGPTTVTVLTASASQFEFRVFDPANPGSTANFSFGGRGQPRSVTAQVTFMPRFTRMNLATSRDATRGSRTMFLRNSP